MPKKIEKIYEASLTGEDTLSYVTHTYAPDQGAIFSGCENVVVCAEVEVKYDMLDSEIPQQTFTITAFDKCEGNVFGQIYINDAGNPSQGIDSMIKMLQSLKEELQSNGGR